MTLQLLFNVLHSLQILLENFIVVKFNFHLPVAAPISFQSFLLMSDETKLQMRRDLFSQIKFQFHFNAMSIKYCCRTKLSCRYNKTTFRHQSQIKFNFKFKFNFMFKFNFKFNVTNN